ncbi:hypothetical protein KY284_019823 [Solanum tuberosum]|nr:hypothetical protein KY284_019823 [Solanum tuberosum]
MKRPVEVEDLEDLEVQPQVKNFTTDKTQAKGNFSEISSLNNPLKKQKRTTLDNEENGRKTSKVWDHFSEITSKVGEVKAKCGKIEHPSLEEDWRDVNVFLKFLEIFYQTTLKFSSTLHVNSNTFFHELFNLQSIIVNYSKCDDSLLTGMAKKMKDQTDAMSEVSAMDTSDVWQSQWEKFLEKENNNVDDKSDLDKYLEDDVEKIKDFNILTWWKASSERYTIVSRIARDILAIPTSTVASESVFSTGGRILDCYRSSLSPKTAEALVCSQQWLRSASTECKIEDLLQEMQNLEIVEKGINLQLLVISSHFFYWF